METLFSQFEKTVEKLPEKKALTFFRQEKWQEWSYAEFLQKALTLSEGLRAIGMEPGDRLGLLSPNSPEWALMDLAVARIGGVLVPIHTTLTGDQVRNILFQSKAKVLAIGKPEFLQGYLGFQDLLPGLRPALAKVAEESFPRVEKFILLTEGQPILPNRKKIFLIHELMERGFERLHRSPTAPRVRPEDISTLIYTSGTTGEMKGVLLTHRGLVADALGGAPLIDAGPEDTSLSILPLSHAFERTGGFLVPIFRGFTVAYNRGLDKILEDIQITRPTVFNAVPRLLEKMCVAINEGIEMKSKWGSRFFRWGLEASRAYRTRKEREQLSAALFSLQHRLADRIFYRNILNRFGGRLSRITCGGAPLDPKVSEFFYHLGIKILEGYGLTEASPIVTVSPVKRLKIGSVGIPVLGTEVKIGAGEEVLVRGPHLMAGYENAPEESARAIDSDGWLHTGDRGRLDEDGYLFLKGRLKELIVTSYGKNIVPTTVETQLEKSPLIKQVMVYGDGRPFLTALIVPDAEGFKSEHPPGDLPEEKLHALLEEELPTLQSSLAPHERVKKFAVIHKEFTEKNGLLTPTLKLKRAKILEKYQEALEKLYG